MHAPQNLKQLENLSRVKYPKLFPLTSYLQILFKFNAADEEVFKNQILRFLCSTTHSVLTAGLILRSYAQITEADKSNSQSVRSHFANEVIVFNKFCLLK